MNGSGLKSDQICTLMLLKNLIINLQHAHNCRRKNVMENGKHKSEIGKHMSDTHSFEFLSFPRSFWSIMNLLCKNLKIKKKKKL
jgi:hypothetical protein